MTARLRASRPGDRRLGTGRRPAVVAAAVFLAVLNLLISYFVAVAWLVTPDGPSDQDTLAGLTAAALVGAALALLTALLTLVPIGLRWLRPWWIAVPGVLLALAVARIVYLGAAYPDLPTDYGLAVTGHGFG